MLYTDPDGRNYVVCDASGNNCRDLSDEDYKKYREASPNIYATPGGALYVRNPDGSETKIGSASYYNERDIQAAQFIYSQVGPPVKVLAGLSLGFVAAGTTLEMGAYVAGPRIVPGWINQLQGHHPIAQFLGGSFRQALSSIPKLIHREFHALLRRELGKAGFPRSLLGGRGGSAANWARHMQQNPGSQKAAFDAVLRAARSIDSKYGTHLVREFIKNVASGNFTPF
ncbi:MAG: hypothetical protein ACREJ4_10960 [Candidatus Methylomirabilaceae bacterium]